MLSTENPPLDLLKPSLDDEEDNKSKNPLPKFSIRDYVFDTRGKDIKNNWPFSQKNLQLCLKYGVKDVLPPFQSLDSLKNRSTQKFAAENSSYSDVNLPENINSSKSEQDKELPSTIKIQSFSNLNQESEYTPLKKVKSNTQNPVKKSRLLLKSNKIAERKSNENLSANPFVPSEATMASKVCPVCKTFTSSSNTTLNAHIDQCLSGESTVKWTAAANAKEVVIKHRIKPRKTRLMLDIYETALQCTLEDLDRRNGTNWASKTYVESVSVGKSNEKGDDVYIDSKSPKLRSLSKLNDLPSISTAKDECGPSKLIVEKDNGCKFVFGKKKKKCLDQKQKLSKCPMYGRRSCSPSPDQNPELEVNNGQRKQCLTSNDQTKIGDLGMIKQWVSSKRTGPKKKKKINLEHENQHRDKIVKYSKENCSPSKSLVLTHKPTNESYKRKEILLPNSHFLVRKTHPVSKDRTSVHEHNVDLPNAAENHNASKSNKKMRIDVNPAVNTDSSFIISSRISQPRVFSSQGKESGSQKFSSLRKKLLSVRRTSVPDLKKKKQLDFKKPCLNYKLSGSSDNADKMRRASDRSSINGTTVLKLRKKKRKLVNAGKVDVSSKKSEESSPELANNDGVGKNICSFVCEPTYRIADGEDFIAFSKSFAGPSTNVESVSHQEMFCSDNGVRDLVAPEEMDADEAKRNYFADVDPIPIPGPPGSFLPSPQRMCSEDIQGNSSLTTCKIQSSEDEHEVVNMDSPISSRSFSGSVLNLSNKSHVQNRTHCGIFEQADIAQREIVLEESKANNSMCCCYRKDGANLQSGCSNIYQEDSHLLRRRSMMMEKEPIQELEKAAANSPMGYDFPSPIRSTTPNNNPVLRLMGKNLMVASKDENPLTSPQTRADAYSSMAMPEHPSPRFCVDNQSLSTFNNNPSGPHPFDRNLSSIFENTQTSTPAHHFDYFDASHSGFINSPTSFRPSQFGGYNLIHDIQSGPNIMRSADNRRMYDIDAQLMKTGDFGGSKYKEIIVIDGPPESEAINKEKCYNVEAIIASSPSSMGNRYDHQRLVENHRPMIYGYPLYNGHPSMVQNNGNIHLPVSKGITNATNNLGNWNCSVPEGSRNLLHPNSLTAASPLPSTVDRLRSSLYFSPGF